MKSLLDDLGQSAHESVSNLLNELTKRVIDGARTSTNNEDFLNYQQMLYNEYGDSIYRVILRARKEKRRGPKTNK